MAIVPSDLRYPDLTASDLLAQTLWPRRGTAPLAGLDVTCIKIAVDFQSMTETSAPERIQANLELLNGATHSDTAFHMRIDPETEAFTDIAAARTMFLTGTPEQLRGETLAAMPWMRSAPSRRCGSLNCATRRTCAPISRPTRRYGAISGSAPGVLTIVYYIDGRPAGLLGIANRGEAHPRARPGMCNCICC